MPPKMARDPRVDEYIASLKGERRELAESLRAIVAAAAPTLTEAFKWSRPVYRGRAFVCYLHAAKDHVKLGFYRGAELDDPEGLLEGTGAGMRHVKVRAEGMKPKALGVLVRGAVKLDAAG